MNRETLFDDAKSDRLVQLWSVVTSPPPPSSERKASTFCTVTDANLTTLAKRGILVGPGTAGSDKWREANTSLFLVPEKKDGGFVARPIAWPRDANRACEDWIFDHELVDSCEIQRRMAALAAKIGWANMAAVAIDLYNAFFQLAIAPGTFVIQADDGTYSLVRAPMGHRLMPEVMQRICAFLADIPEELRGDIEVVVHIDNILVFGAADKVRRLATIINDRMRTYNIKINEGEATESGLRMIVDSMIRDEVSFCGCVYEFRQGTVRLGKKTRDKLAGLTSNPRNIREVLHAFGVLMYASRVMGTKMADFFDVMKLARAQAKRLTKGGSLSDEVRVPRCYSERLDSWVKSILSTERVQMKKERAPEYALYTDASKSGWGAVLVDGSDVHIAGGAWQTKDVTITAREVEAVACAVRSFQEKLRGRAVAVYIDNIPAKAGLRRGYSPSFQVNAATGRVQKAIQRYDVHIATLYYVRSERNPADVPSRRRAACGSGLRGGWRLDLKVDENQGDAGDCHRSELQENLRQRVQEALSPI